MPEACTCDWEPEFKMPSIVLFSVSLVLFYRYDILPRDCVPGKFIQVVFRSKLVEYFIHVKKYSSVNDLFFNTQNEVNSLNILNLFIK